jgi:hypothetical protein
VIECLFVVVVVVVARCHARALCRLIIYIIDFTFYPKFGTPCGDSSSAPVVSYLIVTYYTFYCITTPESCLLYYCRPCRVGTRVYVYDMSDRRLAITPT